MASSLCEALPITLRARCLVPPSPPRSPTTSLCAPTTPPAAVDEESVQTRAVLAPADVVLTSAESAWMTAALCRRFLDHNDGNVEATATHLRKTLLWRREFGVDRLDLHASTIRRENATGKLRVSPSRDLQGHPVLVISPGLENTQNHHGNLVNLVYNLERAATEGRVHGSPDGITVLLDFSSWSLRSKLPSVRTCLDWIEILMYHYTNTLHRCVILDSPIAFVALYRLLQPFIAAETQRKVSPDFNRDRWAGR